MGKALLVYTPTQRDVNPITLENSNLFYIDAITKSYKDEDDLKKRYSYKINNYPSGSISAFYIRSNSLKEEINVLYNDDKPIYVHDNFYERIYSEVEKSRKLLFNSKSKMFIKSFLDMNEVLSTINFSVKLSYNEYVYAKKKGINVDLNNSEYSVDVKDLFEYISNNSKLGILRGVFEDVLDVWKKRVLLLDEEELYYYSRTLRILVNEYNIKAKTKTGLKDNKRITNLKLYPSISKLNNNKKTCRFVKVITDRNT